MPQTGTEHPLVNRVVDIYFDTPKDIPAGFKGLASQPTRGKVGFVGDGLVKVTSTQDDGSEKVYWYPLGRIKHIHDVTVE